MAKERTRGPWVPTASVLHSWTRVTGAGGVAVANVKKPGDVPVVCCAPLMLDMLKRVVDGNLGHAMPVQSREIMNLIDQVTGFKPLPCA